MSLEIPDAEPPEGVELDRERHLRLQWPDGTQATFLLETLRANCPCAECRGLREQGRPVWPRPDGPLGLRAERAELVGNWGISIRWSDGHGAGIFAWGILRAWAGLDDAPSHG